MDKTPDVETVEYCGNAFFNFMNKLPAKTENQHNFTVKRQIYLHKEKNDRCVG